MEKFKAIIFDIDGTLGNTVPLCVQAFRQAMEPQLQRSLSDEEIIGAFGPNEEGTIKTFHPPDAKQALNNFMRYYQSLHDEMCPKPFEGIKELLDMLKSKGVCLAVATGKGKDTSTLTLSRFDLASYFDAVENGAPEGSRKPEAIAQILKSFGVQKEEALYVGDAAGDIKESHQAGIRGVAAAWAGTAKKEELEKAHPDAMFESVQYFAAWLKERT